MLRGVSSVYHGLSRVAPFPSLGETLMVYQPLTIWRTYEEVAQMIRT